MDEDARTIWCGNLHENVSEEILYELFLQAGPLQSVRIPKSREGKQRAFGFVTYKHVCSVPYALALFEGTELFNRELRLQSRNPDRVRLEGNHGRENLHNRSQSAPVNFINSQNPGVLPLNFDALIALGNNLMKGQNLMMNTSPSGHSPRSYASQTGSSSYLGGSNRYDALAARSLQGNWSSRNHPYDRNSGSDKKHGYSRNHHHRR